MQAGYVRFITQHYLACLHPPYQASGSLMCWQVRSAGLLWLSWLCRHGGCLLAIQTCSTAAAFSHLSQVYSCKINRAAGVCIDSVYIVASTAQALNRQLACRAMV